MTTIAATNNSALTPDRVSVRSLLWELAKKDVYFSAGPLLAYFALGILGVGLLATGHEAAFYTGALLLMSAVIVTGAHLVFVNVVGERGQQNLPLVMSLPITYMQYSVSKLGANLGIFLLAWLILVGAAVGTILGKEGLPNGLTPFTVIMLLELFLAYVLVLCVALVMESEAWTIVVMTITNILISLVMYSLNKIEGIGPYVSGPVAVWNRSSLGLIAAELLAIVLLIAATLLIQSRKHDYL
ncbi:MAG: hypothetical protein AAF736_07635 [Pseudomonadota bacterium]